MARDRVDRDPRHHYDEYHAEERPRERRSSHRHHRHYADDDDEYLAAKRARRERRRAEEARREAELDINELRERREAYYSRPESGRYRDEQHMAQEVVVEREARPRSSRREVKRDGTRRKKRREVVEDDRSDQYVYGRPQSAGVGIEVRRSRHKRSDEGGSSNRTARSPRSGSRSASVLRAEEPTISRSMSAREPNRVYMSSRPSIRRTSTIKLPAAPAAPIQRSNSAAVRDSSHRRNSGGGLLANFFRPPPRPAPTVARKEIQLAECLVCMSDEIEERKTVKLACGHRMCHSCLKRQFTLSVKDPQHMPPRCCSAEHIPLKYVEKLFDDSFKRLWNKKYQEYTTGNRLYCPTRGCGEWIKPSKIRADITSGRKYARCGRCNTKVCASCNSRFHARRDCPRDEETNRVVQLAKDKGWQRCYRCKAIVELKEGCNHMTCRCTAQFCMVCAAPWKTCNCPWFNYQNLDEDDRLNDMRVPYDSRQDVIEVLEEPVEPSPPIRRSSTRVRHRSDHTHDHPDEVLAAQLQSQLRFDPAHVVSELRRSDPDVQMYSIGNLGTHHMNESYTVRPLATSAARAAVRQSTPRWFTRSTSVREPPRAPAPQSTPAVQASLMAGLSRDGTRRGANRVGTWLNHVQVDHDAIHTARKDVEVDDWNVEGSMVGID